MNTYDLQRIIVEQNCLGSTEKLVGMVLALHLSKKSGLIRIKQETIARKCSLSERAVRNAIKGLIAQGVFTRKRTFRVDVFGPGSALEEICGIYEAASGAGCKRNVVPVAKDKGPNFERSHTDPSATTKSPFHRDTNYSTAIEEEYKRPLVQNG